MRALVVAWIAAACMAGCVNQSQTSSPSDPMEPPMETSGVVPTPLLALYGNEAEPFSANETCQSMRASDPAHATIRYPQWPSSDAIPSKVSDALGIPDFVDGRSNSTGPLGVTTLYLERPSGDYRQLRLGIGQSEGPRIEWRHAVNASLAMARAFIPLDQQATWYGSEEQISYGADAGATAPRLQLNQSGVIGGGEWLARVGAMSSWGWSIVLRPALQHEGVDSQPLETEILDGLARSYYECIGGGTDIVSHWGREQEGSWATMVYSRYSSWGAPRLLMDPYTGYVLATPQGPI